MFRRKEDSLFDTPNDPNQPQGSEETFTVLPGQTGQNSSAAASSHAAPSGMNASAASNTPAAPAAQPAATPTFGSAPAAPRPMPEAPRAAAPQTASGFRPAPSTLSSDMTRNRMPEAKPAQPAAQVAPERPAPAKPGRRVLTVGNDILLKGEIATCDRLVIEGKVDATLNEVHTVEIAETGSFKGSAQIEDAEISGLFEGDLVVRGRLVIYATGKVRGNISYGEIEIERGGELTGEIKVGAQSSAGSTKNRKDKEDKFAA